jgi:MoaA/NifB/PqqE/SkfB family radical SAM enzyme
VDDESVSLFRLGEQCNNDCPMCSNSGRPEALFQDRSELVRRVAYLARAGFKKVVVTGGEPTIHPGFWEIIAALNDHSIRWDINSHGRTFSDEAFAARARKEGLGRAIISLHSHLVGPSCEISGVKEKAHHETVAGIASLLSAGVFVMVNLVVTQQNRDHLVDFLDWCEARYGTDIVLKVAFPSTTGKGGEWDGIQLRYGEVQEEIRGLRARAQELGVRVAFESFPNCILDAPKTRNIGRSGFGETHYLDDVTGDQVYPIQYIESVLSVFPEGCQSCRSVGRCPGVAEGYVKRYGVDEFIPFT